jgi:metalloendopeptidase OMA1, mitochondrial
VLGHEIGHAVAHHGAERMSEALVMQGGQQALGSALSASKYSQWQGAATTAYGLTTQVGRELPHSRAQESEADHIGLVYMARAGYDPASAIAFWQRFLAYNQKQGPDKTPAFLRTHPVDEVRIRQLQQWLPEAQAAFAQSALRP